jgi:HSP20 family protein
MTVLRYSPIRDMVSLRHAMDRLLEDSFVRPPSDWAPGAPERQYQLPLDVYATENEVVIVASLPGLTPEEVTISLEGDALTIRGELKQPLENVNYLFQERPYGVLARTLTVNVPVDAAKAEATFEAGILTLTLPKAEETKPKTIAVKVK